MLSSLRNLPAVWCLPPPKTGSPWTFYQSSADLERSYRCKRNISTSDHHLTSPTNSNQSAQHQQLMKQGASKANTTHQKYLCFGLDYLHKTLAGDETNPLSQQKTNPTVILLINYFYWGFFGLFTKFILYSVFKGYTR